MSEIVLYKGAEAILAEIEVDPDTGEIGTGVPLDVLVSKNPVGCVAYVLNEQSKAKLIKARIDELKRMQAAAESNAERVKDKLKEAMQLTGVTSIESADKTFSAKLYRGRDKSIEIFDEDQIPDDYLREIPARYEPDKRLIQSAIDDGYEVPGAREVRKDRLAIK
jgi:hypothetical protein